MVKQDGKIERQGTYKELVDSGLPLLEIVKEQEERELLKQSQGGDEAGGETKVEEEDDDEEEEEYAENAQAGAFAAEERAVGVIKWSIIKYYILILGIASAIAIGIGSLLGDVRLNAPASQLQSLLPNQQSKISPFSTLKYAKLQLCFSSNWTTRPFSTNFLWQSSGYQ